MSAIAFLRLTRCHTANVTISGVLLGSLIAGCPFLTWQTLWLALFAFCFHAFGFSLNDYFDAPMDRLAGKLHKPLVNGDVDIRTAGAVITAGYGLMTAIGVFLSGLNPWALFFLLVSIFYGVAYNFYSKKTAHGTPLICASFCALPLFSYFASGGSGADPLIWLVVAYALAMMGHEIAYLGFFKDPSDRHNLLVDLGCKHDGKVFVPSLKAKLMAYGVRYGNCLLALAILLFAGSDIVAFALLMILMALMMTMVKVSCEDRVFDRKRVIKICSLTEIFTFFVLIVALQGVYGWPGVVFFIVGPLVWFCAWNRLLWGKEYVINPNV